MLDQYNENEYDQRAKQSGQEFRNQALNTGYDYFKKYNGNTTAKAANNAVGNAIDSQEIISRYYTKIADYHHYIQRKKSR